MDDSATAALTARICLITGATNGIGRATAEALAAKGATVVVHGRSREKAEETARAVAEATGNHAVQPIVADFAELDQVRRMAAEFRARHKHLHVLVNNAGFVAFDRRTTHDGFEAHFGVNHLAPFVLTNLLLDTLKASAPARIVTVSSALHNRGRIDFDSLQAIRRYSGIRAYATSKLANILFTTELARRLDGTGVTANCLHPGAVASGLAGDSTGLMALGWRFAKRFMIGSEKGARTSIFLATSPEAEGLSGRYFYNSREASTAAAARDAGAAARLWDVSADLAGVEN
jgi:retinol dehydrogenase-12